MKTLVALFVAAFGLFLLATPSEAYAWGPAAHILYGRFALENLSAYTGAVAHLLGQFPRHFLYGCVGADICVWKRTKKWDKHVHNWKVGFEILDAARTDEQRAFTLGYLTHLAADTVAHNFMVPFKLVASYPHRGTSHPYWEHRFDTPLLKSLAPAALAVHDECAADVDEWLEGVIETPVLSFQTNKRIFASMLRFNVREGWHRLSERHDVIDARPADRGHFNECEFLAKEATVDFLRRLECSDPGRRDPTGKVCITKANDLRLYLRKAAQEGAPAGELTRIVTDVRGEFRESLAVR